MQCAKEYRNCVIVISLGILVVFVCSCDPGGQSGGSFSKNNASNPNYINPYEIPSPNFFKVTHKAAIERSANIKRNGHSSYLQEIGAVLIETPEIADSYFSWMIAGSADKATIGYRLGMIENDPVGDNDEFSKKRTEDDLNKKLSSVIDNKKVVVAIPFAINLGEYNFNESSYTFTIPSSTTIASEANGLVWRVQLRAWWPVNPEVNKFDHALGSFKESSLYRMIRVCNIFEDKVTYSLLNTNNGPFLPEASGQNKSWSAAGSVPFRISPNDAEALLSQSRVKKTSTFGEYESRELKAIAVGNMVSENYNIADSRHNVGRFNAQRAIGNIAVSCNLYINTIIVLDHNSSVICIYELSDCWPEN